MSRTQRAGSPIAVDIVAKDGITLSGLRYAPPASRSTSRLAIIAHPYGTLGGTQRDPNVQLLAHLLASHGADVLTYDARGAGSSGGKASWSGATEALDFQSVVEFGLERYKDEEASVTVYCCGYSAGSVAAAQSIVPDPHRARYLLLSYPLGVLWALTALRTGVCAKAVERLARQGDALLLYGDKDQFTGAKNYEKWAKGLAASSENAKLRLELVHGADHFWGHGRGQTSAQLQELVTKWLEAE